METQVVKGRAAARATLPRDTVVTAAVAQALHERITNGTSADRLAEIERRPHDASRGRLAVALLVRSLHAGMA